MIIPVLNNNRTAMDLTEYRHFCVIQNTSHEGYSFLANCFIYCCCFIRVLPGSA